MGLGHAPRTMLFPTPTAHPRKRKRAGASSGPTAAGYPSCDNVGNTLLSCFPLENTTLIQGIYSRFIWNANYPTFIAANAVDAYLFYADSLQVARNWTGLPNEQGMCAILPDDDWWQGRKEAQELQVGRNRTWDYYFVVVPSGERLDGGQTPQNTFRALQTAPPRSVLASLSAASALSTALSSSRSSSTSQQPQSTVGSLQNSSSSGDGFPKWAIAVITILGVLLALTLLGIAIALLRRRTRRHDQRLGSATSEGSVPSTRQDAVGISSGGSRKTVRQASQDEKEPPHHNLAGAEVKNTPSIPPPTVPVLLSRSSQDRTRYTPSPSNVPPPTTQQRPASRTSLYPPIITSPPAPGARDGTRQRSASYTATGSSHSDQGSMVSPTSGRLSGVEAAAVADAFRQAMRKPDFADM